MAAPLFAGKTIRDIVVGWPLPNHGQHVLLAHDQDIASEPVVRNVLERLALPAEELLHAAQSDSNKARLRAATEEAQRRGVFGAPTFFVGEEMFWGNDRLDDALACACLVPRQSLTIEPQ